MKRIYKILRPVFAAALCLMLFSCVKELDRQGSGFAAGDCDVEFQLHGMPLQPALTRTSGDAIRNIDNLYVLFYTKGDKGADDYELAYAFTSDQACRNEVFSRSLFILSKDNSPRVPGTEFNPADGEWKDIAESSTQHLTTSRVQVKRGSYAVYVAANVDRFSSADFLRSEIATPGDLRGFSLSWNSKVADNDAMFGFFTEEGSQVYDVINEAAPLLRFTANEKTVHAWVKRAVSKVTVAFDGSGLRNGVRVFIKSVSIRDIPEDCKLGAGNSPGPQASLTDGEQIVYTTGAGVTNATRISAQEPYFPNFSGLAEDKEAVAKWKKEVHSETADALYFFENLQGKSSGAADANGSWKQQTDTDGNGIPDDRDHGIVKDTKTKGTYIEVVAYYQNDNFGAKTQGDIRYRFMLGKNTTDDFNAERNNHYKLTMCFRNNANDVDWHIDYTDKEDIYIPDTIYVSYEYNTPSMLPIRIVGDKFTSLNVKITESHWYADDAAVRGAGYPNTTTEPNGLPVGFFSLSYDENPRVGTNEDNAAAVSMINNYWQKQPSYVNNGEQNNGKNKNEERTYIKDGAKVRWSDLEAHGYDISTRMNSDGKTVFEANIPLFTRPLIICKWASWTGANPYYSSSRSGKIQLTGTLSGKPYSKTINVVQVPRIENPSGIYRRHDNTDQFKVTLMARTGEMYNSSISFAPYVSKGLWRAVIYRSTSGSGNEVASWFTLTAGSQKADAVGEYIQGDENDIMEFTFKPNGIINQNQVRCGIIKVEYNDYTCTHYIFVRQGYAPMQLEAGKVYWHTFNLYSGSAETSHPCEAGSFFIRGRLATAILDSNTAGFGEAVTSLNAITTTNGTTPGTVTIATLKGYTRSAFSSGTQTLGNNSKTYNPWTSGRVPTAAEWGTLKNSNADALIDKGFGILYGDGATVTQTNAALSYGCRHSDVNTATGKTTRGMRGCFVYNTSDGRNIFLPIGAMGYGRRKIESSGQLQYSFGNPYFKYTINTARRPLLFNLDTNEGAIYWARAQVSVSGLGFANTNSWDINYKTYDFDFMDADANTTPACYIRLVQDTAP